MSINILALESGGERSSAALRLSDGNILHGETPSGQSHSSSLLPLALSLLKQKGLSLADIGGFAFGAGPGSFTGLRISCGLIQGLAYARSTPVIAVNGYEALIYAHWLNQNCPDAFEMDIFFDARLGESFYARARLENSSAKTPQLRAQPSIQWVSPPSVQPTQQAHSEFPKPFSDRPQAAWVAELAACARSLTAGGWTEAQKLAPLYVRDRVAQTVSERLSGTDLKWVQMTEKDLASVMVIENQAYPFPWTSGNFRDSLKAGYEMWVLQEHGAMIGYMVWMRVLGEAHLLNFTLSPARHGHGMGSWMLQSFIGQVRSHAMERILLEVRPSNTRAIGLYEKYGFKKIGLRHGYYPNSAQQKDSNQEDSNPKYLNQNMQDPKKTEVASREDAVVMCLEVSDALA